MDKNNKKIHISEIINGDFDNKKINFSNNDLTNKINTCLENQKKCLDTKKIDLQKLRETYINI